MSLFRPDIERIQGYVPGEQPQDAGWVKLNTNENPYPPSPLVVQAIRDAAEGRLNVYPDPLAWSFRQAAAELWGLDPDWILPANGSDENLTILMRSFVDPGELVAFPYPSYVLYETLADIQGARHRRLLLDSNWRWDSGVAEQLVAESRLLLIPNPNSPSGTLWSLDEIRSLVPARGVLVLDEAYGDFASSPHRGEIWQDDSGQRVAVTRTLSKSYSLAGLRFGYCVAHPDLIAGMQKVKDSYNCDSIAIAAATAALQDQAWMQANVRRIQTTRARLAGQLSEWGFSVEPSEANFVWVTHAEHDHRTLYQALKDRRVLVRLMTFPGVDPADDQRVLDGLRITVGTDEQIDVFLQHLGEVLSDGPADKAAV